MLFLTFNVENLVDKIADVSFVDYISRFDIACLTETFVDRSFDFNNIFLSYEKFVSPAHKLCHHSRKAGGVVLLIKKTLCTFIKEIIELNCPNAVALRIDRCLFRTDTDVLLVACYVAPEDSPLYDSYELKDGVEMLEECILQAMGNADLQLMIFGDLNARTGCEQPSAENVQNSVQFIEDDFGNGHERSSKDIVVSKFGKSLLNLCLVFECIIVNGYRTALAIPEVNLLLSHLMGLVLLIISLYLIVFFPLILT